MSVLAVDTGYSCNAFCGFCPQLAYRGDRRPPIPIDLDTETLEARIRWGAEQGYREIGFSGGEPTIRPDFLSMVRLARRLGYRRIAVTTNGMMFGYRKFAERALDAGLNAINVSLHGPDAKRHDAMMRTPKCFEMAMRGLDNVQRHREATGMHVDLMSMSLGCREVVPHFPEIVRLAGEKGVTLHMIQPYILSLGNTHLARRYFASYEAVAQAIREAVPVARRHGGHIKLFNTPPCLLWDVSDDLERQHKPLTKYKEFDGGEAEDGRVSFVQHGRRTTSGFFRVPDCRTCPEPCDGFRIEYIPQRHLRDRILEALEAHHGREGSRGLLRLGGLELLAPDTLDDVLACVRERHRGRLVVHTAAIGRAHHEQYGLFHRHGADEICFSVRPPVMVEDLQEEGGDVHGNLEEVFRGLEALGELRDADGHGPDVSALLDALDLADSTDLPGRLRERGVESFLLYAFLPLGERWPGLRILEQPLDDRLTVLDDPPRARLVEQVLDAGARVRFLGRPGRRQIPGTGRAVEVVDLHRGFLRHDGTSIAGDLVSAWAIWPWARVLWREELGASDGLCVRERPGE
ncbi:MAG: radical SAM protein [Myxococcota bacterium]